MGRGGKFEHCQNFHKRSEAGEKKMISKEELVAYEQVRRSGVTNMFATNTVCRLSGLGREKVLAIMKEYSKLMQKYPEIRK